MSKPGRPRAAGRSTGGRWPGLETTGPCSRRRGGGGVARRLEEPFHRWPSCHQSVLTRVKTAYLLCERQPSVTLGLSPPSFTHATPIY